MPISIRDVAARAGVSRGTVSQVLNENYQARITPETRARVRQVAEAMGYQPNRLARSLGRRKTDTLGLMVGGLRNPFFVDLTDTAERIIMDAGYQALVDASPSGLTGSYGEHNKLRGWPVDGVLIWAFAHQSLGEYLGPQADGLPVIYMGYPRTDGADWTAFDLRGGIAMAFQHLYEKGHRRISFLSPYDTGAPEILQSDGRWQGYVDLCREAGMPVDFRIMERQEETRAAALHEGLRFAAMPPSERPTALLCHNDLVAIGVMHGLRRAGLRVPDDMALVGFDGTEEARYLDFPLTTVLTPVEAMCRASLDFLFERLGGDRSGVREALIPAQLIVGQTT